jgi:hypothetical protein
MSNVLVPCPCCGRHVRPSEPSCPFCGLTLEQAARGESGSTPWYAIAAVSATLVLSGCPMMAARYGGPPPQPTPAQPSARETMDIYGAPPPPVAHTNADAGAPAQPSARESVEAYGAPPPPPGASRDE